MIHKYAFKIISVYTASLLLVLPITFAQNDAAEASDNASTQTDAAISDNEAFEVYGWMISRQTGLHMGYTEEEIDHILKGMRQGALSTEEPENLQQMLPTIQKLVGSKAKAFQDKQARFDDEAVQARLNVNRAYFAELDIRGVAKTEGGLYYEIIENGSGEMPTAADNVMVHYHGTFINGEVFDSSRDRGTPASFHMSGVIIGFKEGLKLLREGGKAKLYIPPNLGYGNRSKGKIPAGSLLIFEIELIEVKKPVKKEPAPAPILPPENTEID
jgi:FKBP-type peptidyl-prolyl cis-trans isomerase